MTIHDRLWTSVFVAGAVGFCPGCISDDLPTVIDSEQDESSAGTTGDPVPTTNPTPADSTGDTTTGSTTESTASTMADTTAGPGGCGDGQVDPGEDCDDAGESARCNDDCTMAVCGDGIFNRSAGEDCDGDGMGMGGESATCDDDCTEVVCGDGVLNATAMEVCDDADRLDYNFCSNMCQPAPDLVLAMDHVFDTDTGELDGVAQVSWDPMTATWYLLGLEIPAGATLTVVGTSALTLEVDGVVTIAGTIDISGGDGGSPALDTPSCDVAGLGGVPGPGGFAGGDGGGNGGTGVENGAPGSGPGMAPAGGGTVLPMVGMGIQGGGGGGGGHVQAGDPGQSSGFAEAGVGGEAHMSLPPLHGGGGGGGGSVENDGAPGVFDAADDEGGGGGGGGGAIAIHATVSLTVTGVIDAHGGAGGFSILGCDNQGQGGGGAGGSIELSSPATDVTMATLDVSGGLGGVDPDMAGMDGGNGADGIVVTL
ncbi:MAG: hypothetical protein AAGF11_45290 [Myxococcota bacterium]